MSQQSPQPATPQDQPKGDPWHAFGYLVSGVVVYGLAGWLADRWLGTTYLVAIGILVGAGFGLYMTWARFNKTTIGDMPSTTSSTPDDNAEQD